MRTAFALCALFFAAGVVRAQDPVRAELSAALEGRAAALAPNAELREYAALFRAEEKPIAKVRLDGLDRARLAPADLRELSEAYVLLGYFDAGASAGRALQDRDPSGTQGLKLAAVAKLEAKDYAGAAALAQEALKLNPQDKDAAGLLYTARGRGAAPEPAPAAGNRAPPPPAGQNVPAPRAPPIFTARPRRGVPGPAIPFPAETEGEPDGMISRGIKWVKREREDSIEKGIKRVDRTFHLRPGEEKIALAGAGHGATVGIGVGAVLGLGGGMVACAVARKIGVPYLPCVGASGVGGVFLFTFVGTYSGAAAPVIYKRTMASIDKIYETPFKDNSSEAE